MPFFTILPVDRPYSATDTVGLDAGAVLNLMSRLNCREADVLEDRAYAFSVRLSACGLWTIFQRDGLCDANQANSSLISGLEPTFKSLPK